MQPNDASPYLSTADAAAALAVSVSTVKRWVDSGVLPAHVTPGGHRKLLRAEILALSRDGRFPQGDPGPLEGASRAASRGDYAAIEKSLFESLLGGSGRLVSAIIRKAYEAGVPIESLADQIIAPAMCRVGHQWQSERLDIWEEHRATLNCSSALADLLTQVESRAERDRPVAVGGAPEGDPYSIPTQLAQLVLIDSGWNAINLGPNTPLASLLSAARTNHARLIWLSASFLKTPEEFLLRYDEFYRKADSLGIPVAIGGQALTESIRSSIKYTSFGDGMEHLAAFARSLHARPKRPKRGRPPERFR